MEKTLKTQKKDIESLLEKEGKGIGCSRRELAVYSIRASPITIVREWIDKYGRLDMSYYIYTAIGREEDIEVFERLLEDCSKL